MTDIKEIKLEDVDYRPDLYPRIEHDPALIQRYAEILDALPPIEVNQHNILIDGFHRWTAHRKKKSDTIQVTVTPTESDVHIRRLAIRRNNKFGWQLDEKSKKREAIWLYAAGQGATKQEIAEDLSVTIKTVTNYLHDIDKELNAQRDQTTFDMWLACYTQEDIAEAVEMSQQWVDKKTTTFTTFGNISESSKTTAFFNETITNKNGEISPAFIPPIYNVWTFSKKTNKTGHFGNSEQQIVDNLLYLYTEPFDIVLDPFAGGGSTIDVCKKRLRRYWASDLNPIVEREDEIRQLDIVKELPPLSNRWSEVSLTYLDPPYWRQAQNEYSESSDDLANMSLDDFTKNLVDVVKRIASKQSKGAIALLIQPTQWRADNKEWTDHIIDLAKAINIKKLTLENRVSCPYSTEQYNEQQVKWAKENKKLLGLTRELIIWRID